MPTNDRRRTIPAIADALDRLGVGMIVSWRGRTWIVADERGSLILIKPHNHSARPTWVYPEDVLILPA